MYISYHHIKLTLTSKRTIHNGAQSGKKHFQGIMKYYLKQCWSRCLGRGNSSSAPTARVAAVRRPRSLSLNEIMLTANQKGRAEGEGGVQKSLEPLLLSNGQLVHVTCWQRRLVIHKSSQFQGTKDIGKWPRPTLSCNVTRAHKGMWDPGREAGPTTPGIHGHFTPVPATGVPSLNSVHLHCSKVRSTGLHMDGAWWRFLPFGGVPGQHWKSTLIHSHCFLENCKFP